MDIVYSERLVLIKIVMTWLIVPFTLVLSCGSFMSRNLEDSRAVASVFITILQYFIYKIFGEERDIGLLVVNTAVVLAMCFIVSKYVIKI